MDSSRRVFVHTSGELCPPPSALSDAFLAKPFKKLVMHAHYSALTTPASAFFRGDSITSSAELLNDHALSIFPSSGLSRGKSARPPITNSFARYRRAYNDYSNRPSSVRRQQLRAVLKDPSRQGQRGTTRTREERTRSRKVRPTYYPTVLHEYQAICGRRPGPLGKARVGVLVPRATFSPFIRNNAISPLRLPRRRVN